MHGRAFAFVTPGGGGLALDQHDAFDVSGRTPDTIIVGSRHDPTLILVPQQQRVKAVQHVQGPGDAIQRRSQGLQVFGKDILCGPFHLDGNQFRLQAGPPAPRRFGIGRPPIAEVLTGSGAIAADVATHGGEVGRVIVGRLPCQVGQPYLTRHKASFALAARMAGIATSHEVGKDAAPGRQVVLAQAIVAGAQVGAAHRLPPAQLRRQPFDQQVIVAGATFLFRRAREPAFGPGNHRAHQRPVAAGVEVQRAALAPDFDQRALVVEQLLKAIMRQAAGAVPQRHARRRQDLGLDAHQSPRRIFGRDKWLQQARTNQAETAYLVQSNRDGC